MVSGKIPLGYAGEFLVAAKLCLMGYIATLTLKAHPNIDILVYNPESGKAIGLQVKTTRQRHKNPSEDEYTIVSCGYPKLDEKLNKKVKNPHVFVHVLKDETINYYVVPPEEVKKAVKNRATKYLETKSEEKRKKIMEGEADVGPKPLLVKDIEKYKDNWKLIEELLK